MWRRFPFSSVTVLTNSYPENSPGTFVPFSDGFNGFPFSSTHDVVFSTTGVVTFSYTCSISPFLSFLVSTKRYPGISFFGCSPSSVGYPGISFPSLSLNEVLTFSYTCSTSPFGSFLVSTNLYPGISFFGWSPSSVGYPGISFPSLSLWLVLTFS